ncbi:hypothetical protein QGM61_05115 [Pseudohongiella sp. SYSU M77423]|uniref:hypothetical protein n=1 Tax=Pseudohongiella sp. SYSU M77423 TaxID=3042312 RepID=UPI0024810A9A|nr:hypothetical protein [Pseudohongiella sp. SYSU M77423]MDH7943190.1 hypothetical protein [Pseudohongiella sp. SYSU M77423]MEC8860082.1 hypothetical protein [Pseudomonadota bacterium]
MSLTEKRKRAPSLPQVEPDLLDQGITQLSLEIKTLQDWIADIDSDDAEPRRSYEDMLRSRREMLAALQQQKANLSNTANH